MGPPPAANLPPAVVTDLPVLVLLVACWLLLPVAWAHLVTGVALAGLIGVHLRTRSKRVARLFRCEPRTHVDPQGGPPSRVLMFLAAAAAMTITGLLRWAGVPPQYLWHGGISYLLLTLVVVHLWTVQRSLRARLRRGGRRRRARLLID